MFKIEKNIPLWSKGGRKTILPDGIFHTLQALEVGDSFVIECPAESKAQTRVRNRIQRWARKLNISTASRIVENGIRVWRTGKQEGE